LRLSLGGFEWISDTTLSAPSVTDLPPEEADALHARCHAAPAQRKERSRTGACGAFCGRVVEPAVITALGGGLLLATLVRAVAVFMGRAP